MMAYRLQLLCQPNKQISNKELIRLLFGQINRFFILSCLSSISCQNQSPIVKLCQDNATVGTSLDTRNIGNQEVIYLGTSFSKL